MQIKFCKNHRQITPGYVCLQNQEKVGGTHWGTG